MIGLFLTYPPSIGETSLACDPAAGIGIRFAPPFLSSSVAAFGRLGKVSEVREGPPFLASSERFIVQILWYGWEFSQHADG